MLFKNILRRKYFSVTLQSKDKVISENGAHTLKGKPRGVTAHRLWRKAADRGGKRVTAADVQ